MRPSYGSKSEYSSRSGTSDLRSEYTRGRNDESIVIETDICWKNWNFSNSLIINQMYTFFANKKPSPDWNLENVAHEKL